jgi:hypothetical protein
MIFPRVPGSHLEPDQPATTPNLHRPFEQHQVVREGNGQNPRIRHEETP